MYPFIVSLSIIYNMNFKYYKQNKKILERYFIERDLAKGTRENTEFILNKYSHIQEKNLEDLLEEAYTEEDNHVPMRRRKIRKRLEEYKIYLIKRKLRPATINTEFNRIRTFYKHNLIELPPFKKMTVEHKESINDLPTKEEIRHFLESTSNLRLKAIVLFMYSSGSATNEAVHITIQDFIDATREYHNQTKIEHVIYDLKHRDDVVPTFNMYRYKTNTPYYTFCTPEATHSIVMYLESRLFHDQYIDHEDKLFNLEARSVKSAFRRINKKIGTPRTENGYYKLRAHALRKLFASELLKSDMDSMTIDFLSGRAIPTTQQAYFKADPRQLKRKYMLFMNNLCLYKDVQYTEITSAEKEELEYYRSKAEKQNRQMNKIEHLIARYENI